jgi:hypothetical protein
MMMSDTTPSKHELYGREKATTPINNWAEDPFGDDGARGVRDVLESVPFMEELQNEMLGAGGADNRGASFNMVTSSGNENMNGIENETVDLNLNDTSPSGTSPSPSIVRESRNKRRRVGMAAGESSSTSSVPVSRRKKKPKGMPKRPLSAYNLYFQSARAKILECAEDGDGGKIGFEGLGKIIGQRWRVLPELERKAYEMLANKDSVRYRKEMEEYNQMKHKKLDESDQQSLKTLLRTTRTDTDDDYASQQEQENKRMDGLVSFSGLQSLDLSNATSSNQPMYGNSIMDSISPSQHQAMNDYSPLQRQSQQQGQLSHSMHSYSYTPSPPPPARTVSQPSYQSQQQQPLPPDYSSGPDYGIPMPANSQLSFPPLPRGIDPVPPNQIPVPPGMEIILPDQTGVDRKYRVQYACYSMTREAAHRYIESLSGLRPGSAAGGLTMDVSQRHVR